MNETCKQLIRAHAENPADRAIKDAAVDAIMDAEGCSNSAAKRLKREYMRAAYSSADPFAARWWIRTRQIAGWGV